MFFSLIKESFSRAGEHVGLILRSREHVEKLESVCLFPGFIDQENLSLPGRILQAIGPVENDRTPRSDIVLFSEP